MIGQKVGHYCPLLILLTWSMPSPLASAPVEESIDAESRCNSDARDSVMEALERQAEEGVDIDPAFALATSEEPMNDCPEDISLAARRFSFATRLEAPPDELILTEFERVVTAFELMKRGIVPEAIRRPVQYLTAHDLEVERCVELLEYALVKLQEMRDQVAWEKIAEDQAARMIQFERISQADVLVLLAQAHLALDSPSVAAEIAEKVHELVVEIDSGPRMGAPVHKGYLGLYWTLRGEIAEAQGEFADALAFYQVAESYPVQVERRPSQAKRIFLLMGGTEED